MVTREQIEEEARRLEAKLVDEEPTETVPTGTTAGLTKALSSLTSLLKSALRGKSLPAVDTPAESERSYPDDALVEVMDATAAIRHLEEAFVKSCAVLEQNIIGGEGGIGGQLRELQRYFALAMRSQLVLHDKIKAEMHRLYGDRAPWWESPHGARQGH